MKRIFLSAISVATLAVAATFTGCNPDDNDNTPVDNREVLDFESVPAEMLANSIYGDNLYASYGAGQYVSYTDPKTGLKVGFKMAPAMTAPYEDEYNFWNGGTAISQFTDKTTSGYGNQCSVYGTGGQNGSKTFAVVFHSAYMGPGYIPELAFADDATEATFDHMWVTNGTYAALAMKDGAAPARKLTTGDWFKLTITAKDKAGAAIKKGEEAVKVEFYLADFRTATSPGIVTDWQRVDLTSFGSKVHSLAFTITGSDVGDFGLNTPAYFCYDNVAFIKTPATTGNAR
jgi:hypothetical protein